METEESASIELVMSYVNKHIEKLDKLFIRHQNFETKAPDHAVILARYNKIELQLVVSLCMWRNTFQCDIIGEMGSAHITSLCKWGPSVLTLRKRILPSGKPVEILNELVLQDPTWELEHEHFFQQIENSYHYLVIQIKLK
jgi:hypothetical protein